MKGQRRAGSSLDFHHSPFNCRLTRSNSFRITYICKNAPANPYGSHIYKTKDLKPFRITYLQKKGGLRGVRLSDFQILASDLRSSLTPLTSTLTKNAPTTPLT